MSTNIRHQVLVLAVASVALFTNLGGNRLWDRDEPRNAGCAREMLERHDWVTPYFNHELRVHKPVLTYWFMMGSYTLFGESEFSARFSSALLGVGTCLLVYHLGRRLFSPQVGLWSGLILATSLLFNMAGRAATPDAPLIFFCTAGLTAFVFAAGNWLGEPKVASAASPAWYSLTPGWFLVYGMLGVAVLAKGPVGFVLPAAIMGVFLVCSQLPPLEPLAEFSWKLLLSRLVLRIRQLTQPARIVWAMREMRLVMGICIMLAVALPWYVWVGIRTDGAWLYGFLWEHNVKRATTAMEGHRGGIWFYPLAILVGMFPWSVLAGPALRNVAHRVQQRQPWQLGYLFLTCWVVVWLGVFSLARTKLANYITPCYPAAAVLLAAYLQVWLQGAALWQRGGMIASLVSLGAVGVALAIGLPIVSGIYLPGLEWLGAAGVIPLVGAAVAWWHFYRNDRIRVAHSLTVTSLAFVVAAFAVIVPRADTRQRHHELLAAIESHAAARSEQPKILLGSYAALEPSWVYYGRRPVREFFPQAKTAAAKFLQGEGTYLITTARDWEQLKPLVPAGLAPLAEIPYFLEAGETLVVVPGFETPQLSEKNRLKEGEGEHRLR